MSWYRRTGSGWQLDIHAQPGAKKSEVVGLHGDALKVRIAAPPVDGKANAALIDWAARAFGVPKKQVELLHGASARQKMLGVHFGSAAELEAAQTLLVQWLAADGD